MPTRQPLLQWAGQDEHRVTECMYSMQRLDSSASWSCGCSSVLCQAVALLQPQIAGGRGRADRAEAAEGQSLAHGNRDSQTQEVPATVRFARLMPHVFLSRNRPVELPFNPGQYFITPSSIWQGMCLHILAKRHQIDLVIVRC